MRISDAMMSKNYLNTINDLKKSIDDLNKHVSTQQKILAPSDSPTGIAKLLSLNKKMTDTASYISNVQEGTSFLQETSNEMESIQGQISDALVMLTEVNDATKDSVLTSYADKIDTIIDSIISSANSEFEGKYIFGGTDYSNEPFGLSADRNSVSVLVSDNSGQQNIKVSATSSQKINVTGTELFGTIIKQSGNIDSSTLVGGTINSTTTVYDSAGTALDLNLTFTKTAANKYDLTYTVMNGPTTVYTSPSASSFVFDSATGKLLTVDNSNKDSVHIASSANNLDFTVDFIGVNESNSATTLNYEANQKQDIFNALINIRNKLKNGIVPSEDDVKAVNDFNLHILDKLSSTGNSLNQLSNSEEQLGNQKNLLGNLVAKENEVDIAQAILDLQNQDYMLQLSYKMSAMILPKSLVDYI